MVRGRQNGSAFTNSPTPSPKALLIPSEAENPRWKQRGFFSPKSYYLVMHENDPRLRALLKRWRDVEPQGNFEANVWRQIRLAQDKPAASISLGETIGRLLWCPGRSIIIALSVALVAGVWVGIVSTPRQNSAPRSELQFLGAGTLAGSYLQNTSGAQ